jgi:peptidoglycan-associated lipoprotein
MRQKVLTLTTLLICFIGIAGAQSQSPEKPDPARISHPIPVDDGKLVKTAPLPADEQRQFQQNVKDVHFDFDRADLRPEDRTILASDAEWLKAHPDVLITLEGDADERGDIVYNLVLSGERAWSTREALVELGVPADRIAFATGWGKLYPICSEADENCWSQNRRTHFAAWPPDSQQPTQQVASR